MSQTLQANRKGRLEQLFDLAQAYRGWNRRELAQKIGRDPTKLCPESGNPKFDLVLELSEVLDWSIEEVAHWIWNGDEPIDIPMDTSFELLDEKAQDAHRNGEYERLVKIAEMQLQVATMPDERARAYNRLAGGWDGLGRFNRVLSAAQNGLREYPIDAGLRLLLQSTTANAHYTLWQLDEAHGMAKRVIDYFEKLPPENERENVASAHAWYVLGHTLRRMIDVDPEQAAQHASNAKAALEESAKQYEVLGKEVHDSYSGIAHTCFGGILECDVYLGKVDAREAIARILDDFNDVVEPDAMDKGDWLESYGWWSIFGCNITLRHIADEKDIQRYMALFTNKADEIANCLNHWSMRERVFSMQFEGRKRLVGWTGQDIPVVIDQEDIRLITGTMGRFPQFRDMGWSILNCGNIVQD